MAKREASSATCGETEHMIWLWIVDLGRCCDSDGILRYSVVDVMNRYSGTVGPS